MSREMNNEYDCFGKVPLYWDIKKIKNVFTIKSIKSNGVGNLLSVYLDKGVIPYSDSTGMQVHKPSHDLSNYQVVNCGDFVLNNQQAWRGSVGVSKHNGIISPAYVIYEMNDECDPSYMGYLLRDMSMVQQYELSSRGVGTIQRNIFVPWLKECLVLVPPFSEQHRIADFLDKKCSQIDEISKKIHGEIEILEEYKKSVITEAVTKGLDPNEEMKDSGIEWIGEIPKEWKLDKGKYIFEYLEKPVKDSDGVITCFRDGEVTLRANRRTEGFTESLQEIGYQGIDVGDLIVHGMDGFAGSIGISDSRGKASPVLNNLGTNQNKKYYMYFLRMMAWKGVFISLATGIRVRTCDTNWGKLREIVYLLPPIEEQNRIAEFLDKRCAGLDWLINQKKEDRKSVV